MGLGHQLSAASMPNSPVNAVFLAARRPLRRIGLRAAPRGTTRWLLGRLENGPWVGVLHAPNYVSGIKRPFLNAVVALTRGWRGGPAIIGGDTNTGIPPLDGNPLAFTDWESAWIGRLGDNGWRDAYRMQCPNQTEHTWFSPNGGNGYRLDQAFVNAKLAGALQSAVYQWGRSSQDPERREAVSDHAALIVDLDT